MCLLTYFTTSEPILYANKANDSFATQQLLSKSLDSGSWVFAFLLQKKNDRWDWMMTKIPSSIKFHCANFTGVSAVLPPGVH
jgi:hypothetical protein